MTRTEKALALIREAQTGKERVTVAIDGPCASGKTTLARELAGILHCPVIHMDEFFLRPEQRTPERLAEAGGNLDRERFLEEVLRPLHEGKSFSYCPFVCKSGTFGSPVTVNASPITIIEGSYSCHPDLRDFYHLRLLLTVTASEQLRRLRLREGNERLTAFLEKWIPMEEKYFNECGVTDCCVTLPE